MLLLYCVKLIARKRGRATVRAVRAPPKTLRLAHYSSSIKRSLASICPPAWTWTALITPFRSA